MEPPKAVRFAATTTLLLLIAVLILQALGYGIGFFFDPAGGLGEFATRPPDGEDALTVALVGLVGAGMLGAAVLLAVSAALILRENPAGSYLAMAVGGVYVLAGLSAMRSAWVWDGYFYLGTGGLVLLLAAGVRWLSHRQGDT